MGQELPIYVPDRMTEGYGPSPAAFRHLREAGYELVVTVDCGAAAYDALAVAGEIGLEVVVIDHHLMREERRRRAGASSIRTSPTATPARACWPRPASPSCSWRR